MSRLLVLLLCGLVASAYADSCTAYVSAVPRPGGAWVAAGNPFQIFDLYINNSNSASCTLLSVTLNISSAGNTIFSSWNIDNSGSIEFNGATIPPGGAFTGAGVVITGSSPSSPLSVSVSNVVCDSSCAVSSSPTSAPASCDPQVSQYGQNTITAVAWALSLGKFWRYVAQPGSSGYGYALDDCLDYFLQQNLTNGQSSCEFIYVGNNQPFSIAVSSSKLAQSNSYAYGLGIGDNAQAIALQECNCAIASHSSVSCSIVQQSQYM